MSDGVFKAKFREADPLRVKFSEFQSGGGGTTVQADWAENNEAAAGYVKNRTHYVKRVEVAQLLDEAVLSFEAFYDGDGNVDVYFWDNDPERLQFVSGELTEGDVCVVKIDGVEYSCTALLDYVEDGYKEFILTNRPMEPDCDFDPSSGLWFMVLVCCQTGEMVVRRMDVYPDGHTEEVREISVGVVAQLEEVAQLDEKYIPDTIARVGDVEKVTGDVYSWAKRSLPFDEDTVKLYGQQAGAGFVFLDGKRYLRFGKRLKNYPHAWSYFVPLNAYGDLTLKTSVRAEGGYIGGKIAQLEVQYGSGYGQSPGNYTIDLYDSEPINIEIANPGNIYAIWGDADVDGWLLLEYPDDMFVRADKALPYVTQINHSCPDQNGLVRLKTGPQYFGGIRPDRYSVPIVLDNEDEDMIIYKGDTKQWEILDRNDNGWKLSSYYYLEDGVYNLLSGYEDGDICLRGLTVVRNHVLVSVEGNTVVELSEGGEVVEVHGAIAEFDRLNNELNDVDNGLVGAYDEIDALKAALGSYVDDVATLVGGDA